MHRHERTCQASRLSAVRARHSATTDKNGFFSLELRDSVKPGDDVRIHLEKQGYRADDLTVAASESVTHPIEMSPIQKPSASHKAEDAREALRHSFVIKDFTVDWTLHLPAGLSMEGVDNPYVALSRLYCRPQASGLLDLFLVPPDAAPFGKPKLIMEVVLKRAEDANGCGIATSRFLTTDEDGKLKASRGFGYDLSVTGYDKDKHLLKLQSQVRRYTLVEMKLPPLMLSDFGAPWPKGGMVGLSYGVRVALIHRGKIWGASNLIRFLPPSTL